MKKTASAEAKGASWLAGETLLDCMPEEVERFEHDAVLVAFPAAAASSSAAAATFDVAYAVVVDDGAGAACA